MPCGLIYSSLAWAATTQSAAQAAGLMFFFGLGTLPAMLSTSLGAQALQTLLRRREMKTVIAALLIGFGSWSLYGLYSHSSHSHEMSADEAPGVHHQHH